VFIRIAFLLAACTVSACTLAQEHKACSAYSELDCIRSTECKLQQTGEHGKYVCRDSVGRCELGFRQAGDGDIRKDCEAMPGCHFEPGSCFCPPNVACVCGGGPPAQCVERTAPKAHPERKTAVVAPAP
jgi:hypothetical protein